MAKTNLQHIASIVAPTPVAFTVPRMWVDQFHRVHYKWGDGMLTASVYGTRSRYRTPKMEAWDPDFVGYWFTIDL